ncbi:MAG: PTS glucose transporter subunit IIA [Pseudomonadota bacterium]
MQDNVFPITAPVTGRIIDNARHPSAIANNQLFGLGPVLEISGNQAVAPISGSIDQISSSGDFIQIRHSSNALVTLILGQGRQFTHHPALMRRVAQQQHVQAGQILLTINQSLMRSEQRQQRYLMVLLQTNSDSSGWHWRKQGAVGGGESRLFQLNKEN